MSEISQSAFTVPPSIPPSDGSLRGVVNHIELQLAHAPRNAVECHLQSHAAPGTSNQDNAGIGGLSGTDSTRPKGSRSLRNSVDEAVVARALLLLASSGFRVADTTAKHNPNHDSAIFNKCFACYRQLRTESACPISRLFGQVTTSAFLVTYRVENA